MDNYIFHYVNHHGRLKKLHKKVCSYHFPLLMQEKALLMKLNQLNHQTRVSTSNNPTLVHLKAVDLFTSPSEGGHAVRRAPVLSAECLPYLGTDHYIR